MSKITACLITRDAPCLAKAIASIRAHVDEIVIIDTGSEREDVLQMLRDLQVMPMAATVRVERFTECNDADGKMADFALARNRSFSHVRTEWALWLDSDDEVAGAENLRKIVAEIEARVPADMPGQVLFPYEYSYHPNGSVSCLQHRERLFRHPQAFKWTCPVHEVCLPVNPERSFAENRRDVVWQHRRGGAELPSDPGRNLRIMLKWIAGEGALDPRARFYFAQELCDAQRFDEALHHYEWHFTHSGWDDERMMGMMRSSEIYLARNDLNGAIRCAQRLIELRDDWGEGWFALGRAYAVRAEQRLARGDQGFREDTARACRHFKRGLELAPTNTPLFINPRERAVGVHEMYNKCLGDMGDVHGAVASCEQGLAAEPGNSNLRYNRGIYLRHLAVVAAHGAIDTAAAVGALAPDAVAAAKESLAAAVGGHVGMIGRTAWPAAVSYPEGYPANVSEDARPTAVVSPHAHAWAIPVDFEPLKLPLRMEPAQLRSLVMALWHEYVLHDEIINAENLLANAPYRVRGALDIKLALKLTQKMTAWMDDPTQLQKFNAPEDTSVECGDPLPGPISMAAGQRLGLVLERLKKGERVLDLGCFDGAFTNRMGLAGASVVGVDLCKSSVELANKKAAEFNTGAQHVDVDFDALEREPMAKRFETVTTTDTWEHLRDPGQLVRIAEKHLLPGGRMLITTPLGSWMRGVVIPWAHPWRWGKDIGKPWICDEPHAHLHAPSVSTVAREFSGDMWTMRNCYAVRSSFPDVAGQGWVFCEAVFHGGEPPKRLGSVAFVLGQCWERWTPRTAELGGIGGSETAVVEMAKRLAALGWDVAVFGDMNPEEEGFYDGVQYLRHEKTALVADEDLDVLVAWRDAALLNSLPKARVRLLWVHDIWAANATHANMLKADAVLALSVWHGNFLREQHALPDQQIVLTANGVDVARFDGYLSVKLLGAWSVDGKVPEHIERDPHKVIYSSSPDRGLLSLLQMWPRIRAAVPDATLHVFYGFDTWRASAQARGDAGQLAAIDQLIAMMRELEPQGVHVRGRVDQKTLAREMLSAGAWLYPTWFTETFCIGAAEAQCAGLQIVTSPIAALEDTARAGGGKPVFVEGDWLSQPYQDAFVNASIDALLNTTDEHRNTMMAKARRVFSWDVVAGSWSEMLFAHLLEEPKHERLLPYVPHPEFKRAEG